MHKRAPLPDHAFRIGEADQAYTGQLPDFRRLALHVFKAREAPPDTASGKLYALGGLLGDACLKLGRPWPLAPGEVFVADPAESLIADIAERLLPLPPETSAVRVAFLMRLGEFLDIALHQPERLPAIIANLDALTNERLTERARAILTTGTDPGAADLWDWTPADLEGAWSL